MGFSAFAEQNEHKTPFDTGYSDVWQRNAKITVIDLNDIDIVAPSHFNDDHTRGLLSHCFNRPMRVVCHPRVLTESYDSDAPHAIQNYGDIRNDTAIGLKTEKGAVVVTRCAHSDVCTIARRSREVTGQNLYAVIRGFHMMKAEEAPVDETINWFRKQFVEILLPVHCVEFEYLANFHAAFSMPKLGAGDLIEI